jgi:hypothetical protein
VAVSDYAIVHLVELDDVVAGQLEGLQGRFARKHLASRDLGISRWTYAPGTRGSGAQPS